LERIDYRGWPNCYRFANERVDLIVTTDVGPRIIRFGFVGEENEFHEFENQLGLTGGDEWRVYGGHRLWHAPEAHPRSYHPDNAPVQLEQHDDVVCLIQPTESTTGIRKEIDVRLSPDEAHVEVTHRLVNTNLWSAKLAPWALSVMAKGGTGIVPLPPRGSHEENLLPTGSLTLWAYTEMQDPRWTWGDKYMLLRQDPSSQKAQKAGLRVPDGWAACVRQGHLFVKKFAYQENADYPDLGSSVELFTNADMLEVETLAPLIMLGPDASIEHVEHWFLFHDVPVPENDADVERLVLPKVQAATIP
jgi:hypothetical protein